VSKQRNGTRLYASARHRGGTRGSSASLKRRGGRGVWRGGSGCAAAQARQLTP